MQNVTKETVVQVNANDTPTRTTVNIIYFIAGVIEITLLFRLIFKMMGANPGSAFVSGIYMLTEPLVMPFRGIFPVAVNSGVEVRSILEPAAIIGMVVYAALAWGIVKLITILARHADEGV